MAVIFIRTLIIFVTLVVVMRLMGKRQIGEMQPFELVITLIIADLACVPMADISIPLVYGIVAILALFVLHQLLSLIEQSGEFTKHAISGKPSVVIDKNGVNIKELNKNNMDVSDLIESLRAMGYFALDDVDYAIFESNGKLSALKNPDKESGKGLPALIINKGEPFLKNLPAVGGTADKFTEFIKQNDASIKNTEVMTLDENGRVYLKQKNRKFEILNFNKSDGRDAV